MILALWLNYGSETGGQWLMNVQEHCHRFCRAWLAQYLNCLITFTEGIHSLFWKKLMVDNTMRKKKVWLRFLIGFFGIFSFTATFDLLKELFSLVCYFHKQPSTFYEFPDFLTGFSKFHKKFDVDSLFHSFISVSRR